MVGVAAASGLLALAVPAVAQIREFAPGDMGHWTDANNNFNANAERAETLCQQLLGDRYGRAVSRRPRPHENGWYFSHLVCETKS